MNKEKSGGGLRRNPGVLPELAPLVPSLLPFGSVDRANFTATLLPTIVVASLLLFATAFGGGVLGLATTGSPGALVRRGNQRDLRSEATPYLLAFQQAACSDWPDREEDGARIWLQMRAGPAELRASILQVARDEKHPLRLTAISALRCFGSEQGWEHASHRREGTRCLLGKEEGLEEVVLLLSQIIGGEDPLARSSAILTLGFFRTRSAVDRLIEVFDREDVWEVPHWALEQIDLGGLQMVRFCGCESLVWGTPIRVRDGLPRGAWSWRDRRDRGEIRSLDPEWVAQYCKRWDEILLERDRR